MLARRTNLIPSLLADPVLRDLDRIFDAVSPVSIRTGDDTIAPPIDVWQDNEAVHVETELPGVTADNVEIDADRESLVIRATRTASTRTETAEDGTETTQKHTVVRTERSYGRLERRLALPVAVNPDDVTAQLKDGVLTVRLPRAEANGRKRIQVTTD